MEYGILDFLGLLGAVGLFLYGMKVMSEGLQKAAGDRLRSILGSMTRNRFTGTLTGFFITALIQSSSASIVMVVSFVNAGLVTLAQSMAVIFGANVGTTFTAWMLTLFGFKVDISAYAIPLMSIAVIMLFSNKSRTKSLGEFLIGFALLFLGLDMISNYVPDLQSNPGMFEFLQRYTALGFRSVLIFFGVGCIVTMIIQSSAATFAITLIMFSRGWINFDLATAIVLGSAVGTTITPILASMSGNAAAKRTAAGHLMFNILGSIWCLALFYKFTDFILWITDCIGTGDPNQLYDTVNSLKTSDPQVYNHLFDTKPTEDAELNLRIDSNLAAIKSLQYKASVGLCVFYTTYKLINLFIMIWFTKLYVKVVEWLIPAKKSGDEEFQLKFISGTLLSASELNITQAEKEMYVYSERVGRMINMARELVHTKPGSDEFNKRYSRLEKYEEISDRMELEIANYLNRCAEGRLSNQSKRRIAAMLAIDSEIESIADCSLGIGKILLRKQQSDVHFTDEIYSNIDTMFDYVDEAMNSLLKLLEHIDTVTENEIIVCYNHEREINNMRNTLRLANISNINEHHYEYQSGIYYMDIISTLEKTGDYIINVVDTLKNEMRNLTPAKR
ncbi:MAG: Na/Pi cotransporter family protein [Muribaculaceae bacterium]|nr:Na/Pi cotransporter family protein [Muribaculaceae bacterium]